MNNFGYKHLGHHVIIKLNCKLSDNELASMEDAYGNNLSIYTIGKGLTRIEGALRQGHMQQFCRDLHIAKLLSKRDFLDMEISLAQEQNRLEYVHAEIAMEDSFINREEVDALHREHGQAFGNALQDAVTNNDNPLDDLPF